MKSALLSAVLLASIIYSVSTQPRSVGASDVAGGEHGVASPWSDLPSSASHSPSGAGACAGRRYAVVLLGNPTNKSYNLQVYDHIAETVHLGLRELALDSVRVTCVNLLDRCAVDLPEPDRQVIVVGANMVPLYVWSDSDSLDYGHHELAAVHAGLLPADAILYNFEFITPTEEATETPT